MAYFVKRSDSIEVLYSIFVFMYSILKNFKVTESKFTAAKKRRKRKGVTKNYTNANIY